MNRKKLKFVGAGPVSAQKGITLIALVITIIVMLILVAVTISMAVNGGLFDYAGKAVEETENAIDKEQLLAEGKIEVGGVVYDSIDDYLTGNLHKWTRSGDTFTCSHCDAIYTMGQIVNYTAEGKESTTITAQMSGLDKYYAKKSSYPSDANVDANGNQTIEAQDANWVVLGIEDKNGDGINETLLITTESSVSISASVEGLYFGDAASYNDGPEEINRVCKELYSNSEYGEARGMTIEDVNNALNYIPSGATYYDGSNYYTTGNLTTKLKDLSIFNSIIGTNTPDGKNTQEALGEYILNSYRYYTMWTDNNIVLKNDLGDMTSIITEVEYEVIFGDEDWYWLASRNVNVSINGNDFWAYWGLWGVEGSEIYTETGFCSKEGSFGTINYRLRPVVPLTSKLPTVK